MATIGSIVVAFRANLKELEDGIEDAIDLFDDLSETIDGVSEKLEDASESTVKIKTAVDTSAVKNAARQVRSESEQIEKSSPRLRVQVDREFFSGFARSVKEQTGEISDGFKSFGQNAAQAFRTAGDAAVAVGGVLNGAATSVDGLIASAVRLSSAYGQFSSVIGSAVSSTEEFVVAAGGLGSVFAAVAGNMSAAARLGGAVAGTLASTVAGVATYATVIGVASAATAGLSEESREFAMATAQVVAGIASVTVSSAVMATTFQSVATAILTSKSASEAFTGVLMALGSGVASVAKTIVQNFSTIATVLAVVNVASGRFSQSIARMGAEAESTRNMAERFGSTVDQMKVLGFAADSAGVSMSQLAKAQQAFYTSVGKIKIGQLNTESTKEAKIAFDKLGISIEDLRNKSPQDVFSLVGDRLNEVKDASERTAIAFDLFGKQGGNILPALRGLKEAAVDAARLGTIISKPSFKMLEGVDQSFDRLNEASKNLSQTMMVAFLPLQTGLNNMLADITGGLATALEPMRTLFAAATVPVQVMAEVAGRLINIFLRLVGAVGQFVVATTSTVAIAAAWSALGDVIKAVLVPIEATVSAIQKVASAFASSFTPAVDASASVVEKLVFAAKTFATTIVAAGVSSAIMQSFGIQAGAALAKFAAGLLAVDFVSWGKSLFGILKLATIGITNMAVTAVKNFTLAGISAVANFVTPAVAGIATFITSLTGLSAASMVTGVSMAAAWAIGTAGLTVLLAAGVAVYQNFDKLSEYFSNFSENVKTLFTFEGAAEAAKEVAGAIWKGFMSILSGIGGFVGRIISNIVGAFREIKPPPAIDAARASAEDIIKQRQRTAQSQFDQQRNVQVQFSAMGMGSLAPEVAPPPVEDYTAMASAINRGREEMASLSYEAAAFGSTSKEAVLESQNQFNKLLEQLSKGEINTSQFEEASKRIQKSLRENIDLADVISPEEKQQFLTSLQDASKQAAKAVRDISAGTVVEGTLFPTSDAIKSQADAFKSEYDKQLKDIAARASEGAFGEGEQGKQNMLAAQEDAAREFQRNMDRIGRDTSFADEIRKNLTTAFLDPVGLYEKRLKEIADNQSLSPEEKNRAIEAEQRSFAESAFGRTQGDSLRERRASLDRAIRPDANGRTAIDSVRAGVESRRLQADRAQAAGAQIDPGLQLQIGLDKVNDIFGVAGKSFEQIVAALSPQEFLDYQKAMSEARDATRASVGVEKSSAAKFSDYRQRLLAAVNDGIVTEQEKNKALKKQRQELLSSLGVDISPVEAFEAAVDKISENASILSESEFGSAVDAAKDKLLSALGIAAEPMSDFADLMEDLNEAVKKGKISQQDFAKGSEEARKKLAGSLGIKEDPLISLGRDIAQLENMRNATEEFIDPKTGKRNSRRIFTDAQIDQAIQDKRDAALPGSVDRSAMQAAKDIRTIDRAQFGRTQAEMKKQADAIRKARMSFSARRSALENLQKTSAQKEIEQIEGKPMKTAADNQRIKQLKAMDAEFNERRLSVQADLEEKLKGQFGPDRRGVEGADARSKAGVDTFFRILRGDDNPSLKAQLDTARNTRLIVQAMSEPETAPVVAQLAPR